MLKHFADKGGLECDGDEREEDGNPERISINERGGSELRADAFEPISKYSRHAFVLYSLVNWLKVYYTKVVFLL